MASSLGAPAFAYTVVYCNDVAKSADFYGKAFGYTVRRLEDNRKWAELESGSTTIAFTPIHQRETDGLTGQVQTPQSQGERHPFELCFDYADVDEAYRRAVENGAVPVNPPEDKTWGQRVGYVRDIDGNVVRMGSHVNEPKPRETGIGTCLLKLGAEPCTVTWFQRFLVCLCLDKCSDLNKHKLIRLRTQASQQLYYTSVLACQPTVKICDFPKHHAPIHAKHAYESMTIVDCG